MRYLALSKSWESLSVRRVFQDIHQPRHCILCLRHPAKNGRGSLRYHSLSNPTIDTLLPYYNMNRSVVRIRFRCHINMRNVTFPRWAAPFVGIVVGAICGFRAARGQGKDLSWEWLVGGAVLGLIASVLILLVEPLSRDSEVAVELESSLPEENRLSRGVQGSGSVIGPVLALLSGFLSLVPIVGVCIALAAFIANNRSGNWARAVSAISLVLSLVITFAFFALLAVGRQL